MIHTQDADFTLLCGDVLDELAGLPDESVHCVVTSPPYWGLRCYGVDGQYGLEETPELYVARMVEVFREVRRVLRADGTCWVNLGDSYASSPPGNVAGVGATSGLHGANDANGVYRETLKAGHATKRNTVVGDLKAKDLCGIPWMVAFALRADGWYLRSDIIWAKPNPMPESVTDRPTKAHEYVFLLTKQARYFFDQEAVREKYLADHTWDAFRGGHAEPSAYMEQVGPQNNSARGPDGRKTTHVRGADGSIQHRDGERWPNPAGRNVRSVWEIATQPYPEAHFATYPEELVRRCVLAGSSERGCCPVCGKPWERETAIDYTDAGQGNHNARRKGTNEGRGRTMASGVRKLKHTETLGWRPGCDCPDSPEPPEYGSLAQPYAAIPCTVLDPFIGSGTTAYVARKHGRRSIGIELNPAYADLAAKRMAQQSLEFSV